MFRRHPILSTLLLIGILLVGAATIFIATLDLNRYRPWIEQTLSERVRRPVAFDRIGLDLWPKPAIALSGLHVGEAADDLQFGAEQLLLKIHLKPLLKRQVDLSDLVLHSPRLRLALRAGEPTTPPLPAAEAPPALPTIDTIAIVDGSVEIIDRRMQGHERTYTLTKLDLRASGIAGTGIEHLSLNGHLDGKNAAKVHVEGRLKKNGPSWRQAHINLSLKTGPLRAEALPIPRLAHALKGQGTLALTLRGVAGSGMDISGRIEGTDLALYGGTPEQRLLPIKRLDLTTTLIATPESYRFRELKLHSDDLSLSGSLMLRQHAEGLQVEGVADAAELPVTPLLQAAGRTSDRERTLFAGSRLTLQELQFDTLREGLELPGLQAAASEEPTPKPGSLKLHCRGQLLAGKTADAGWDSVQFDLSVMHDGEHGSEPEIILDASSSLGSRLLQQMLPEQSTLSATGRADLGLHLEGPASETRFDLSAELSALGLQIQDLLNKKAGQPGRLHLRGQRTPEGIVLDDGTLALGPLQLSAQGQIRIGETAGYDLTVELAEIDLGETHEFLPIIGRLHLLGTVAGRLALQPRQQHGAFKLRRVGMPIKGRLGDLNGLSGHISINNRQLSAPKLIGSLGTSPITLALEIPDLSKPRVKAHVQSPAMRASDLIFRSDEAYLRDLVGDVVITADEVSLEEVTVRLDGGTRARVEGTISPLNGAPDTLLLIDAEYGDIDEVIALFQGKDDQTDPSHGNGNGGGGGQILIDIYAKEGKLGSLPFTDAQGHLSMDQGLLTLHPLQFRSGPGYFTGMVLWDGSQSPPHPLKISGHLEDFDAETLYRQQLKHQGIVTGKLRGDFYLEGRGVRDEFLKSSQGAFNLEINSGVLRKFKILAKIFSVLNVSQLLKFQLPDTSSRGMPYDTLTTTVLLKDGVLQTDDLFIDSDAMDMTVVGTLDLPRRNLDLTVGIKPLQTVDKIVTKIPIAGWLLTGEEKALVTTHFEVKGEADDPTVRPIPISDVSDKAVGIFKRLFKLPGKIIDDVGRLLEGGE